MKFVLFFSLILLNSIAYSIETIAKQAILYDYETKSIMFEKNSQELMSPSSMSKIMTIYFLFKKINDGEVSLSDKFPVSKKAWKKGGSKMFLNVDTLVSVEDLIRGIIVQSGNDACIALAEGISGSEQEFVNELNDLKQEIGLTDSNFTNSTGWPDPEHLTTVKDLLTLTIRTIEDYPELYHYYAEKEFTYNDIKQLNRNPLLFNNENADGLKTGHTSLGGYGLVATVKKNNRRIILILNGLKSSKQRSKESSRLINVGFKQFKSIQVAEQGKILDKIKVWGGNKKEIGLYSKDNIAITIPKGLANNLTFAVKFFSPIIAPVAKDQQVAEFVIKKKNNNEIIKKYELYSKEEVKKMSFFSKAIHNFKYLLLGDSLITR